MNMEAMTENSSVGVTLQRAGGWCEPAETKT